MQFRDDFDASHYREQVLASNPGGETAAAALSLYFHLPFCATVCYCCACNKIITANRKRAAPYLSRLHREIELQAELFGQDKVVEQCIGAAAPPLF